MFNVCVTRDLTINVGTTYYINHFIKMCSRKPENKTCILYYNNICINKFILSNVLSGLCTYFVHLKTEYNMN